MKIGDRIFVNKPLTNKELEKEPFLFIEEIEENGVVIMGGRGFRFKCRLFKN